MGERSMIKKISEEIVHSNPFWIYKHDVFQHPDGRMGDYYYGEDRGMAIIVPMLPDGRLIYIKQFRYLPQQSSIAFPGGGIRVGESAGVAAERELREETGYGILSLKQIGKFEQYIGVFKAPAYVYFSFVTEQQQQILDETEYIEVCFTTSQEFETMVQRGEIIDGGTLATWAIVRSRFH